MAVGGARIVNILVLRGWVAFGLVFRVLVLSFLAFYCFVWFMIFKSLFDPLLPSCVMGFTLAARCH
jgi:hypothetical protein